MVTKFGSVSVGSVVILNCTKFVKLRECMPGDSSPDVTGVSPNALELNEYGHYCVLSPNASVVVVKSITGDGSIKHYDNYNATDEYKRCIEKMEEKNNAQASSILSLKKDLAEAIQSRDKYKEWFHIARDELQVLWDAITVEEENK